MKDKDKYKVVNSNSKKDDGTKTSTLVKYVTVKGG